MEAAAGWCDSHTGSQNQFVWRCVSRERHFIFTAYKWRLQLYGQSFSWPSDLASKNYTHLYASRVASAAATVTAANRTQTQIERNEKEKKRRKIKNGKRSRGDCEWRARDGGKIFLWWMRFLGPIAALWLSALYTHGLNKCEWGKKCGIFIFGRRKKVENGNYPSPK